MTMFLRPPICPPFIDGKVTSPLNVEAPLNVGVPLTVVTFNVVPLGIVTVEDPAPCN